MQMLLKAIDSIKENSRTMDTTSPQSSQWDSNNPVKWSELRRALVPQDFPDWPLLSKEVGCLKCIFCGRVYYSIINFRRHQGFHDRLRNSEWFKKSKDKYNSLKKFWDTRYRDIMKDIVSLQDVELKGVTGRRILENLASIPEPNIRLPRDYFKARNVLLDIVKSEDLESSVSPNKFFDALRIGSEDTFPYFDLDESVQNYVFLDAENIALAPENQVATTCFLLEQKLRKAWRAHLDDLRNELIKEEEDEKTKQPERNKVEGKKKKNKKKPKKQSSKDKSEEGNLGQTSETQQSTATSRPEVPTSVEEDSQTPVAQLENLPDASEKEDGECKQEEEEGSKEQKSEDKICQDMIEASDSLHSDETAYIGAPFKMPAETQLTQPNRFPGLSQVRDAEHEEYYECKKKEEKAKEIKSKDADLKDVKNTSYSAHFGKTLSCDELSKNPVDMHGTQSNQSSSPRIPVVLSDDDKHADAEYGLGGRETREIIYQLENVEEPRKETSDIFPSNVICSSSSGPPQEVLPIQLPDSGGSSSEHPTQTQVTEPDQLPSYAEQLLLSDAVTKSSHKEPETKELSCQTESNVEEDKETSDLLSSEEISSSSSPSQVGFEGQLPLEAKLPSANELVLVCSKKDLDTKLGQKTEIKQLTGGQIDKAGNFREGAEKASHKLLCCENSATVTEEDLPSQVTESDQLTLSPTTYSDAQKNAEEILTFQHFGASTHLGTGSHSRSQLSSSGKKASRPAQSCNSDSHQLVRDRFRRPKSSKAVQKSSHMRGKSAPPQMQWVPKVFIPKNVERGKCGKKDAAVERMQPSGQHETGAAASVGMRHKTQKIIDSEVGGCSISVTSRNVNVIDTDPTSDGSEENASVAPLSVDDLNNVQADLSRAWGMMLSRRPK